MGDSAGRKERCDDESVTHLEANEETAGATGNAENLIGDRRQQKSAIIPFDNGQFALVSSNSLCIRSENQVLKLIVGLGLVELSGGERATGRLLLS